jgi:hypothetical protein
MTRRDRSSRPVTPRLRRMDSGPWNALTAIATVLTAAVAVWAIINAKQDSRDRSQPVMVAEFRVSPDSETAICW